MVHVHSRKFCCCLPVRIAVFLLSGFGAVIGSIAAAATWYIVARAQKNGIRENGSIGIDWNNFNSNNITNPDSLKDALDDVSVDKNQFIALIVSGVVLTLWGLFSWFGFIGSIIKKRSFVAIFSTWLWYFVGLQLGAFIFNLIQMIRARNDKPTVDQCISQVKSNGGSAINLSDDDIKNACQTIDKWVSNVAIIVYCVGFAIGWGITIYLAVIIKRYVEQLDEEQAFKHTRSGNVIHAAEHGSNTSYYPHQPLLNHHEMAPPAGGYPYAAGSNAFGSNKH